MKIGYNKLTRRYYVAEHSKHPEVQKVTIVQTFNTLEQAMAWVTENKL